MFYKECKLYINFLKAKIYSKDKVQEVSKYARNIDFTIDVEMGLINLLANSYVFYYI